MHIGSHTALRQDHFEAPREDEEHPSEASPLIRPGLPSHHSTGHYGSAITSPTKQSFLARHNLPDLPRLRLPGKTTTPPLSSHHPLSPSFERTASNLLFNSQRPISAYDAPYISANLGTSDTAVADTRTNGIRVWYSSFSSIDWLHDNIKDADRLYRLRRRKSVRGRIRNLIDRFVGWFIVTIVGFLTAVFAFFIVRSEQWLFDIKEGYCSSHWYHAKRWCCPGEEDVLRLHTTNLLAGLAFQETEACPAWREWGEVLTKHHATEVMEVWTQYAAYTIFAVRRLPVRLSHIC